MEVKNKKRVNSDRFLQLKALMLFLYRGISNKYSFRLGAEINQAKKFDNLVFEYTENNNKIYRLLQVKHKLDESKKITSDNLLNECNGVYSLIKYYLLYRDYKNDPVFKDGIIKDITICTNIDFDLNNVKSAKIQIQIVETDNDIFYIDSDNNKSVRYKFYGNTTNLLKTKLLNYHSGKRFKKSEYSDEAIKDFLKHFFFAVNQHNQDELKVVIEKELGKKFDFETENAYNKFFADMSVLSCEEGKKIFEDAKEEEIIPFSVRSSVKLLWMNLSEFTMDKSVEFITKSLGIEDDSQDSDIKLLATELQCFPLALQQAVVYINTQNEKFTNIGSKFNINDYIKIYKEKTAITLDYDSSDDSYSDYNKTIFTTCNMTLQIIKQRNNGSDALEILNIISYLAPDNIPIELFFDFMNDKEQLADAIQLLEQYVIINVEQKMINIHRLIQQVVRLKLQEENNSNEYIIKAVKLFNKNNLQKYNVNHAIQIWNYSSKHTELMEQILPLAHLITFTAITNGMLQDGYSFGSKVLKVLEPLLSNNIDIMGDFLTVKLNVATALMKMDRLDESLKLLIEIRSIEESISPFSEMNLIIRSKIVWVLCRQGKFDDALKLNTSTLRLSINKLGKNHRSTLLIEHDIAITLIYQEKYDEAKEILQRVYKSQKDNLGENDLDTLNTLDTIAVTAAISNDKYKDFQQYKANLGAQASTSEINDPAVMHTRLTVSAAMSSRNECECYHMNRKMQIDKTATSKINYPNLIATKMKKATEQLVVQGKWGEALKMLEEICIMQMEYLDKNHSDILLTKYHMAEVLRHLGRYSEALTLYESFLDFQTENLGSNHPDVLNSLQGRAHLFSDVGNHHHALHEYQMILKKRKIIEGENHPNTLKLMTSMATLYSKLQQVNIAYKLFEKILHIQKNILPDDHFDVITANVGMAIVLYHKNQHDQALKILDKALDIMQKFYPDHPDIFVIKNHKGLIFRDQKKYTEALKIFGGVINAQIEILGNSHPSVQMTLEYVKSVILAPENPMFE